MEVEKILEEKTVIGIRKEKAEELKKILTELKVIDRFHRTLRIGELVFFPVLRELDEKEVKEIEEKLGPITIDRRGVLTKKKLLRKFELLKKIKKGSELYERTFRYLAFEDAVILEIKDEELLREYIELIKLEKSEIKKIYKINNFSLLYKGVIPELLFGEKDEYLCYKDENLKIKFKLGKTFIDPRLKFERNRLVNEIKRRWKIAEICAGSSMLSLDIAEKRNLKVLAIENDFELYEQILHNAKANELEDFVKPVFFSDEERLRKTLENTMDFVICWDHRRSLQSLDIAMNLMKKNKSVLVFTAISKEPEPHEDILHEVRSRTGLSNITAKKLLKLSVNEYLVEVKLSLF